MTAKLTNIKKRFLALVLSIVSVVSLIPAVSASAAEMYSTGGWAIANEKSTVYDANGKSIGSVYAFEGFTVLEKSGTTLHIEYSTSGDPKEGYLHNANVNTYVSFIILVTIIIKYVIKKQNEMFLKLGLFDNLKLIK